METMTLIRTCPQCRKDHTVTVGIDAYGAWQRREGKIQNLMPELTASQRELIMTGICDPCWQEMWAE